MHKGYTTTNTRYVLDEIKFALKTSEADIVFLQEIHGTHPKNFLKKNNFADLSEPLEHIADSVWSHYSYGKNAVYSSGHHGNAILSKYPIQHWENIDISSTRFAKRGLLHVVVNVPEHIDNLHLINVHLDLLESARSQQLAQIFQRIKNHTELNQPLIVGGDFNDWRQRASIYLQEQLDLKEAFLHSSGAHCKSFPSAFPLFALDRIYYRGLQLQSCCPLNQSPWKKLSDHIPLTADFTLS